MNPDTARIRVRSALLLLAALGSAAPAAAQAPGWKLGLTASETWISNVRLAADRTNAFTSRFSVKLSRNLQAPRWQLGLNGAGSQNFFHGGAVSRLNKINYSGGMQFGYQFSARASLSVKDSFRSSYTGDVIDLVGLDEPYEGEVLLPHTNQKRNSAHATLSLQVSALTTASVTGSYYTALFQQDEASQPRLRNGDKLSGGLGLSRKLSLEDSVNLTYSFAKSDQRVTSAHIQSVSLGYARVLGEFTNAGLFIGASRREAITTTDPTTTDPTTTAPRTTLTGGLAVARELENSSVSLGYNRNLEPLFGFGRDVVHDTFRLSMRRTFTRSLAMNVRGSYSRNRDPSDPSFSYNAWSVGGGPGFNLNLDRGLHLNVGYSFAMRDRLAGEAAGPRRFQSHRVGLQLGWNTAF